MVQTAPRGDGEGRKRTGQKDGAFEISRNAPQVDSRLEGHVLRVASGVGHLHDVGLGEVSGVGDTVDGILNLGELLVRPDPHELGRGGLYLGRRYSVIGIDPASEDRNGRGRFHGTRSCSCDYSDNEQS